MTKAATEMKAPLHGSESRGLAMLGAAPLARRARGVLRWLIALPALRSRSGAGGGRPSRLIEGVIWAVDWRRHVAQLHTDAGVIVLLCFSAQWDEEVTAASRRRVRVTGTAEGRGGRRLRLTGIELADAGGESEDGAAWRNRSIDELAALQRVGASPSPEALGGDWPEGDEIDELLAELRRIRE